MKKCLLLLIMLFFYACSPKTESAVPLSQSDRLPEKRPEDFVLTSIIDGGKKNYRSDLFISKDSCYLKSDKLGVLTVKRFMLTESALDRLYAVLKENRFDEIQSTLDTLSPDRGGVEVSVSWSQGQHGVRADDEGQMFVIDEWSKQWGTVLRYLDSLIPA